MHEENAYDTDAIHEYGSPGNCPLLRYNVWAGWCPTYVLKKATWTLRWFSKLRGSRRNLCMMHMQKAQHGDVHSTTIFTNEYKQKGYMTLYAWQCEKWHAACLLRAPI